MNLNAKSANRLLFPVMLAYIRQTQYQENDNTARYQVQNKPFVHPQTKPSFRVKEDALSWQKSMYQLFWSCHIKIWRRKPKWVQKCSWSNSQGGMLQCLVCFPQLQTPHLALKTQSSTSSELEMCEKTEAAVPVLGSFTLYSTHPKPPKETHQRAWRMVTCCGYPSQKWHLICQTSEDRQIYQVYYTAGMKQELCSGTCL